MGESREEKRRRLEEHRQAERRQRDAAIQRSLDAQAAEEATKRRYEDAEDEKFIRELRGMFGDDLEDIRANIRRAPNAKERAAAEKALAEIHKLSKRGKRLRARRIAKQNKTVIKNANKAGKKASPWWWPF